MAHVQVAGLWQIKGESDRRRVVRMPDCPDLFLHRKAGASARKCTSGVRPRKPVFGAPGASATVVAPTPPTP